MSFPIFLLASITGILVSTSVLAADLERGKLLYENHCRMCHESVAFKRDDKIAHSYEEVRAQVSRWQANTSLHWSAEDVANVASYVTKTYYRIPCPDC